MRTNRWAAAAAVAALLGGVVAAFAPLGQRCAAVATPGIEETCRRVSLFSQEGTLILLVAAVPVGVTFTAVLVGRRPIVVATALLLWIGCAVALASVGIFFLPAAILMTIAAAKAPEAAAPLLGPPSS